jgi:hypothetical protein
VRVPGSKCGSRKNSAKPSECIFFISLQTRIAPRKIGFGYDDWMSGQTIYGYVGGNPVSHVDPTGEVAVAAAPLVWPALVSVGRAVAYVGSAAAAAMASKRATEEPGEGCKSPCSPCKTVSGRVIPSGTVGYRPLDVISDDVVQHGVAGSHHNIFIANQNPNNCKCFWAKQKYVLKPGQLPPGSVPVEPFAN